MRSSLPWLGLAVLAACGGNCGGAGEPAATDAPTGTSTGSTTGNDVTTSGPSCPPAMLDDGGYDPCSDPCEGGGQCLSDGRSYAVCTRGCFSDCDCWPSPGGTAPARCSTTLLDSAGVCVLDCGGGAICPAGTSCIGELGICAHPYVNTADSSGTATGASTSETDSTSSETGSTSSESTGGSTSGGSSSTGLGSSGGT